MQVVEDEPDVPEGVTLRDPEDTTSIREDIEKSVMSSLQRYVNGYSYGGVRLELKDLGYQGPTHYTKRQQNDAKLNDRLLARRLKGTVRLVDETTNKVIDERPNITLARVPWLTERGTFINNGSEFSPVMQSRLLPGAYTRRRDNGELETHFNVRPGTGSAMRVTFDPATAQYRLKVGSSDLHAYSVFRDLGVTDDELARRWGPDVLAANKAKYSRHTLDRLYNKAIPKWERDDAATPSERIKAIRDAFDRAQVADSIIRRNLPNLFTQGQEKVAHWRKAGAAIQIVQNMVKESSEQFLPDLTPDQMLESYNSIYGNAGPQLASMTEWPAHWLDDQDGMGWLQWYQNYHAGRRSETDARQMARWKSFKARHGSQFVAKPTPRRAFALRNWGIDPIKLLPATAAEQFQEEMDAYRRKEYVKWFVRRHDFDDMAREKLLRVIRRRGGNPSRTELPSDYDLMQYAIDGLLQPEDLK